MPDLSDNAKKIQTRLDNWNKVGLFTLEMKSAEKLAEEHWSTYVRVILKAHGEDDGVIEKCGVHYRTAFVHGFKHGAESTRGGTDSCLRQKAQTTRKKKQ